MANRRMFSKSITNSSQFLMMSQSAQNLYFHFGMNADDDGFCEIFTVMRMTESKPDDLRVLQARGFVKLFDDKVLIITHWKENNYLRIDRYTPSKYLEIYKEELKRLDSGIPTVDQMETQDRLGKVRLGKDSIESGDKSPTPSQIAKNFFNDLTLQEKIITNLMDKGVAENMARQEIKKFISYWTELNKSGTKQRWEMEKTFQVERRLTTWFSKVSQFSKGIQNKLNITI